MSKNEEHQLVFSMKLHDTSQLVYGNLALIYPSGETINYLCTSGCTGFQDKDDQWVRARGPIPQREDYFVPTKPYYLPTKGIEGNFYHIQPDPVKNAAGIIRGEFGIHFDANVPGSAGCIVFKNRSGWRAFEERMIAIHKLGIKTISLKVEYN
ncbi:hypothetical protein [Floridanema evergladense]|uniref:DUF2778 domain-containing protein n=1 Tax=Floridaenema evergladense BLCC-F167 TaxID=3153639 RepID=A0ABV4WEJ2_9CYAN